MRPENVRLSGSAHLRGEIYGVEYLGTTQIALVRTAQGVVKVRLGSDIVLQTGQNVGLELSCEKLSVFDRASGRALRTALEAGAAHV